ncbi:MAG: hypothetical protein M1818_006289 [Claussenomyces sp. TS43310]|nr:MAG: hypothetical protein M1818_006289 [Claussenomyces sp. TS43310]
MNPRSLLCTLGLMSTALATNLYVSSYSGTITSLSLTRTNNASYSLASVAVNTGSSPNPSFLNLDRVSHILYCVDEGLNVANGSVASYSTAASGALTLLDRQVTLSGPVASIVYNSGKALALPHYSGSALTTWSISPSGALAPLQNFTFVLASPSDDSRQDAPHPHETLIDPTDSFVLVPDLGADLVRIFSVDPSTSLLTESTPLVAPTGSGPRHAAFLVAGDQTYLFLVTELTSTLISYKVNYDTPGSLAFEEVMAIGIYGDNTTRSDTFAAEVVVSPDDRYLLTSSRGDNMFTIPSFNGSGTIQSDTLQAWQIDPATGRLTFEQLAPAGGSYPRQFSVNRSGTLAAVALQKSSSVVIVERHVDNGTFGAFVAEIPIDGEITSVVWDE